MHSSRVYDFMHSSRALHGLIMVRTCVSFTFTFVIIGPYSILAVLPWVVRKVRQAKNGPQSL